MVSNQFFLLFSARAPVTPSVLCLFLCLMSFFFTLQMQELSVQPAGVLIAQLQERDGCSILFWARVLKLGSQMWLVVLARDCLQVRGLPGPSLSPV